MNDSYPKPSQQDASASPLAPAGRRGEAASTSHRHALRLVPALILAAGCGKGAAGNCPARGDCGGNPAGNWAVTDFCQVNPVRPAQPEDVTEFTGTTGAPPPMIAPPQPNPVVLQQTTSGD